VSKFENINKLTIVIYNSPQVYLKYIDYLLLLSYSEVLLRIFTVFFAFPCLVIFKPKKKVIFEIEER
jgi:hypothetical protein